MRRAIRAAILATVGCLTASVGCSSGPASNHGATTDSGSPQGPVKLYTWWVAPGEAQALQGLIDTYTTAYPGGTVDDSGTETGADTRANLDVAFTNGTYPDVFQLNFQDLPVFMTAHPNEVASVDSFFADAATKSAFLPDILAGVTVNGHIQAIPVDVPRESAFFYNKASFAARSLTPPTTLAELMSACATLKSAGVTPIALATGSSNGWIVRELFNAIVEGTMGASVFKDFITGAKPVTDPEITPPLQSAIATLGTILTQYINADSASTLANGNTFGWTDAADEVQAGKAAMFLHGDWVKGYWTALGWTPGVDFGETGAPGASDVFFYGIDVLGTPVNPPDLTSASDFLTVAASGAGQAAFSNAKGSSPARIDVGSQLDVLGQATLNDLLNATVRIPVVAPAAWDTALGVYSSSPCGASDQQTLYQVYVANPPSSM
jgi:glucose/mannose transport system substrate-binding protein